MLNSHFVFGSLHSTVLLRVAEAHCFSFLCVIPLYDPFYGDPISFWSILCLMGISAVFNFCLLCVLLPWTFVSFAEHMHLFFLTLYIRIYILKDFLSFPKYLLPLFFLSFSPLDPSLQEDFTFHPVATRADHVTCFVQWNVIETMCVTSDQKL